MNHKNSLWCDLALVLDSTSWLSIKQDCVDIRDQGDGRKAWVLLQQRFWMRLWQWSVWCEQRPAHNGRKTRHYTAFSFAHINCQHGLVHAEEDPSEPLPNAMVPNDLPERYEQFVMQRSFNPTGRLVEHRTRILHYEVNRNYRESVEDSDSHVAMTSKKARPKNMSSKEYSAVPKSSSGQLTC